MKIFNKVIRWTLVVLWMIVIFYLSHQPATESSGLSGDLTEMIIRNIERFSSLEIDIDLFHHMIRKNAHFFAYFILSILNLNALKWSGFSGYKCIGMALIISVIYAISDEVHQLYIPGRSGEVKDVFIDTSGALVGILVYLGIGKLWVKLKYKMIGDKS